MGRGFTVLACAVALLALVSGLIGGTPAPDPIAATQPTTAPATQPTLIELGRARLREVWKANRRTPLSVDDRARIAVEPAVIAAMFEDEMTIIGVVDPANLADTVASYRAFRRDLRVARLGPAPAIPDGDAANPIDRFIVAAWARADSKSQSPQLCDDATFLRRVYLDLIGIIPTIDESRQFLEDRSPDKREHLIVALLARNEDYAIHWAAFWEDALGGIRVRAATPDKPADAGAVNGELISGVGPYRAWLLAGFGANRPYDVMFAELFDPDSAVGNRFVHTDSHENATISAANTAQVFLGTGMKCASCHNHFLNDEWPQERFTSFAGLFASEDLEVIRCERPTGAIAKARFPFELLDAPATLPVDPKARLRRAAQLVTDPENPRFAKTIVNRLWKRYLGLGFFEPVDDYREDRPPSHPELLDWLADDFLRHGCDLKHTIRLILTSRTYQLAYDPALEDAFNIDDPGAARYFRSPQLRRLWAEQFVDSIRLAANQSLAGKDRNYFSSASTALTQALGRPANRREISTSRSEEVAVIQALELMNGAEVNNVVYNSKLIHDLPNDARPTDAVDRLYRAALSRPPSERELELGIQYLRENGQDARSLGDLFWSLLASPEFAYVR